jgi:hypothetical protein
MHKPARLLALLLAPTVATVPAAAKPAFPLHPLANLSYSPETPRAVAPDHPLYNKIAVNPVLDMPKKIGWTFVPVTNEGEFNEALQQTFAASAMLAPEGSHPKARLVVRWVEIKTPLKISTRSEASVTVDYSLVRVDNGQTIFSRTITTTTESRGGDATERLKGNARLAIMTNLASAWNCLDQAAYGRAPQDCALKPNATFRAPQPPTVIFMPKFR